MPDKSIENRKKQEKLDRLQNNLIGGSISRRNFITGMLALGVSLSEISALLNNAEAAKSKPGETIMSDIEDSEKYACPHCGCAEYITNLNAYDIYLAMDGEIGLQSNESADCELELFCRDCAERAPAKYESAADAA